MQMYDFDRSNVLVNNKVTVNNISDESLVNTW